MEQTERRDHPRQDVMIAVMVAPNGDMHRARVLNLSRGGTRVGLPDDWTPNTGAAIQIHFRVDADRYISIRGHVVRVGMDHLGVEFDEAQEERIAMLFDELAESD